MMKIAAILFTFFVSLNAFAENISEQQIVQNIINQSIVNYSGRCPCPYNRTSNGSSCGKRSAYSRAGGYSPLCYPSDVTPSMILSYKQKHGIRQ
jgi:hypothetical protein